MSLHEKLTWVFVMTILVGVGYMIFDAGNQRQECVKMSMAQNYSAAEIRKICR